MEIPPKMEISADGSQVSVVIPSYGRPKVLEDTVRSVLKQTVLPAEIILSVVSSTDVTSFTERARSVRVVYGPRGISAQRNTAVRALDPRTAFVLFLDDDVELVAQYVETCLSVMNEWQEVAIVTGDYLAEHLTREQAQTMVSEFVAGDPRDIAEANSACGSNMFARAWVARKVLFDEALPLYGWLEDFDWSVRAAKHGRIVRSRSAVLAHLSFGGARISPRQLGYSQIVNPYYLWKKHSIDCLWQVIGRHWSRPVARNLAGCVIGSDRRERIGRLNGNAIAFWGILRGRGAPMRMADL